MGYVEMWTKNHGSVELYRVVYAYQKLSKGTALFEIVNYANTIKSNTGDKK